MANGDRAASWATCGATPPIDVLAGDGAPVRLTWTLSAARTGRGAASVRDRGLLRRGASEPDRDDRARSPAMRRSPSSHRAAVCASREVRYYRVRVQSTDGWSAWSDVAPRRSGAPRGIATGSARRSRCRTTRARIGTSPPRSSGVRSTSTAPVRHARLYVTALGLHRVTLNGHPVDRRSARARLDAVSKSDCSPMPTTSPTSCCAARTCSAWPWATAGIAGASAGRRRRAAPAMATEVACLAQLELDARGRDDVTIATDDAWRASTGEIRSADLYDGCRIDLRERQAGWDRPGFDDRRLGPGRDRAARSHGHRASERAAGPGDRRPPHRSDAAPGRRLADRRPPERRRLGAATRPRSRRVDRHRASRGGARARRVPAYPLPAIGAWRPIPTCSRMTPMSTSNPPSRSTGSAMRRSTATSRSSMRRSSPSARSTRGADRSPARSRSWNACTRTSCGRCATTSSRCRPTAPSVTSGSAGPVTPRRSRRPPRCSSTHGRSG